MKRKYINGTGCVSAQNTHGATFGAGFEVNQSTNILQVVTPVYKDYISPVAIRRMAKGVKNGIVAAANAMKEANIAMPAAILTGTGLGCMEDSDKFLTSIINNNEEFLTPTSFIQSTHNTVGAQIALNLQCNAYNFTYVNAAVSFESALMDAMMQMEDGNSPVLVGGVDEMTEMTSQRFGLAGIVKKEGAAPYVTLSSTTTGVVYGEGATFFVLENDPSPTTYAEIVDLQMTNRLEKTEVESSILGFLASNGLVITDIDAVVLGYGGDADFDTYYQHLSSTIFASTQQVYYKHLCGEYNTASAFGLWIGAQIIKWQTIPPILKINDTGKIGFKNLLLYNQYNGKDHSFILITQCRSTT